ncbi:MAG: biopolymer transporter ExbD [Xanthomonadaceae bacterium]|nr:biopolymer transporter ExbD [Xanthomonadaceae bacterium]
MSFGRLRGESSAPKAEINMIPLIDVMLVLLVIFILTAPLVTQSVQLTLPEAVDLKEKKESIEEKKPIMVAINGEGEIFVNEELAENEEAMLTLLGSAKMAFDENHPGERPMVQLHIDTKVQYEVVAKTITGLSKVGLSNIGFVTLPDEE